MMIQLPETVDRRINRQELCSVAGRLLIIIVDKPFNYFHVKLTADLKFPGSPVEQA